MGLGRKILRSKWQELRKHTVTVPADEKTGRKEQKVRLKLPFKVYRKHANTPAPIAQHSGETTPMENLPETNPVQSE